LHVFKNFLTVLH